MKTNVYQKSLREIEEIENEIKTLEEEQDAYVANAEADAQADAVIEDDSEESTYKGRYSNLRREFGKKTTEFKELEASLNGKIAELEAKMNAAPAVDIQIPEDSEEFEAWKKEYPQAAEMMERVASQQVAAVEQKYTAKFSELEEKEQKLTRKQAEVELTALHPDWLDIKADENFHAWVEEQPTAVQKTLYEEASDAVAVGKILNYYKAETSAASSQDPAEPKKKSKAIGDAELVSPKQTPTAPKTSKGKTIKESDIENLHPKEFEAMLPEIQKAQDEGRFEYDLSRAG
jgi:hypothetical protein